MNLRKLNLGLVALLLGFGLVLTQSAFTPKEQATRYRYVNNTATDIDQVSSWEPITGSEPSCGVETDLPCVIMVDGDLATYLEEHDTVTKILSSDELESSKGFVSTK